MTDYKPVLMQCGCVAMTWQWMPDGTERPACFTHFPDAKSVTPAENPPSLAGRMARCDYYGRTKFRDYGPIYGGGECSRDGGCKCIVPSDYALPFFVYQPEKEYDKFFCGCAGWD